MSRILFAFILTAFVFSPVSAKEAEEISAVSVYVYAESGSPDANKLFVVTLVSGNKEQAEKDGKASCEEYAGTKLSIKNCKKIEACDSPGWFAVASAKSMGKAGLVCGMMPGGETDADLLAVKDKVLAEAKAKCGGPICAKIKIGVIKAKAAFKKREKKKNI